MASMQRNIQTYMNNQLKHSKDMEKKIVLSADSEICTKLPPHPSKKSRHQGKNLQQMVHLEMRVDHNDYLEPEKVTGVLCA